MERYYYSIASGSSGNCGLYRTGGTAVLIDLGVSLRKITTALHAVGLTAEDLSGVLLTHAHIDHVKGLEMFLKKHETPIFATEETAFQLRIKNPAAERITVFEANEPFSVGTIAVEAFATPHDCPGSVGYILSQGGTRLGFATDLGFMPSGVCERLCGCDTVVLESNHDPFMLQAGPYPYPLKQRVAGQYGHLSNPDCAVCAAKLVENGTKTLILAHLSEKNNVPALALQETKNALRDLPPCAVYVAPKERMDAPILLGGETQCSMFG